MKKIKKSKLIIPSNDIQLHYPNMELYYYYIFERQEIWYNRFVLKKDFPWSEDKIFQDYKFTNTYRELDRNSQYVIRNIINKKYSPFEQFFKIIIFRYYNNPELFDFMGGVPGYEDYNRSKFEKYILKYKEKSGRTFTDAFMRNPPKHKDEIKRGIELFYCDNVYDFYKKSKDFWKKYKDENDVYNFVKMLEGLKAIAGFMSYEFYGDMCYTDWFKWNENDYTHIGPGAQYGIKLIYPYLNSKGIDKNSDEMLMRLKQLRDFSEVYFQMKGLDFKYYNKKDVFDYKKGKRLTLREAENALCETGKLFKMINGVGKPRKRFEVLTNNNYFVK